MKKSIWMVLALFLISGSLLMPAISHAVPGNGNGNGYLNGNGHHYGWGNGNGGSVSVPEPSVLFLLGSGLIGLAGWMKFRKE